MEARRFGLHARGWGDDGGVAAADRRGDRAERGATCSANRGGGYPRGPHPRVCRGSPQNSSAVVSPAADRLRLADLRRLWAWPGRGGGRRGGGAPGRPRGGRGGGP